MKNYFLIISIALLSISSCKKEESANPAVCLELTTQSTWTSEAFKPEYSIQFPDTYEGVGMAGFEGPVFLKQRADGEVEMAYAYCNPLFCEAFGEELEAPGAASVTVIIDNENWLLDQKLEFCENGETLGIFYYKETDSTHGKLYWKDGNSFKDALTVSYSFSAQDEVLQILQSIQHD